MAFPFFQAPTVGDFVQSLVDKHGCELNKLDGQIVGPRGPVTIEYLSRDMGGTLLLSEPLPDNKEDRLSPDTARRLIVQLKLPRSAWLWAGDPYTIPDDDWPENDEDEDDDPE